MIREQNKIDSSHDELVLTMQGENEMQRWQRIYPEPPPSTHVIGHRWDGMKLIIRPELRKEQASKSLQTALDEVTRLTGCLKQISTVALAEHPNSVAKLKEMARQALDGAKPMPQLETSDNAPADSELDAELRGYASKNDRAALLTRAAELGLSKIDKKLSPAQMVSAILDHVSKGELQAA